MRLIRLVLVNMKRQLKNPLMLLMTFIFPIFIIIVCFGGFFVGDSSSDIGIIDKSNSKLSKELVSELKDEYEIVELKGEAEKNYDLLRDSKVAAIYVIDQDFDSNINDGKVPNVECYKKEDANGLLLADDIISNYVSKAVEEDIGQGLSSNAINAVVNNKESSDKDDFKMTVLMICYFMLIGGSIITGDILKLKEQKVLRRTIATSNTDIEILGSLFISTFIIQGILSSAAFVLLINILNIPNADILQGILIIFLSSVVSTAIVLSVTRWIKTPTIASLTTVLFGLITFVLGVFGSQLDEFSNVPRIMGSISVISPFTWFIKIIDKGQIVVPILVVVLISAVFFTAGSFKLREFVKE